MLEANMTKEVKIMNLKRFLNLITIIITVIIIAFVIYGIKLGLFQDKTILINYIKDFGIYAPLIFIFFQIVQVIIPVIPGGISCLAGVLAFGPIFGFIYNYIGLLIGSCFAYFLAKKYGIKLIKKLFKKETIDKYLGYIQKDYFSKFFFIGIFLPGLPDDLLCYIAGMSRMNFQKFFIFIVLGKPISLLIYSMFMKLL